LRLGDAESGGEVGLADAKALSNAVERAGDVLSGGVVAVGVESTGANGVGLDGLDEFVEVGVCLACHVSHLVV